jgi:hypothetical protein
VRETDALDREMIRLAASRAEVLFLDRSNNELRVRLICWQGRAGRSRCRIEYSSGKAVTVPTFLVRPI